VGLISSVTARTRPEEVGTAPTARGGPLVGLTRLRPPALPWVGLAAMLVAAGIFLMYETRGTTLWFDEWMWALGRRDNSLGTFLEPHNSHLSLVPLAIYRLLFATAGLDDYAPYRALVIGAHLTCVVLVFLYASRRVGGFLGLLAAALILFLGPAAQNIIWPFQISWLISLAAGLGALLLLDRDDRVGDLAACVLLALSLASSGIGVPVALGLLVDVLWGRRRLGDTWIIAVPLALYGLWWLIYQDSNWVSAARAQGIEQPVLTGILRAPGFAADSAAAAISALAGLGRQTGLDMDGPGTFLQWGPALVLVAAAAIIWRSTHLGRIPPRVLTLLTIVVSFWVFTAVTRGFISDPHTSRYLYVGGLFVVLLAVELARGTSLSPPATLLLAAGVAAAVLSNVGALRDNARYLRAQGELTRAQVGALDITRPVVEPGFVANSFFGIAAGPYFAAADADGTPAFTPAQLATEPEHVRAAADSMLTRIHEIALGEGREDVGLGTHPEVDSVAGGAASTRTACVSLRPAAFTQRPTSPELQLTLPSTGVLVRAEGGPAAVEVRRFADRFQPVGNVAASGAASLRIRSDLTAQPWHVRLVPTQRVTVCGLT
jgi:hypothetical protein